MHLLFASFYQTVASTTLVAQESAPSHSLPGDTPRGSNAQHASQLTGCLLSDIAGCNSAKSTVRLDAPCYLRTTCSRR